MQHCVWVGLLLAGCASRKVSEQSLVSWLLWTTDVDRLEHAWVHPACALVTNANKIE